MDHDLEIVADERHEPLYNPRHEGALMHAIIVYESMYGNTHRIAEAIGEGLREIGDAEVMSVHAVSRGTVDSADLVIVGGPTHAHGMSRDTTRQGAAAALEKPGSDLALDPDAAGEGVREWLGSLGQSSGRAAAFDTRVDMSPVLTGRASKGIAKQLAHHGFQLIAEPMSFLVTKETHLEPEETERARNWGRHLGILSIR